jgi:hypothetical protein
VGIGFLDFQGLLEGRNEVLAHGSNLKQSLLPTL